MPHHSIPSDVMRHSVVREVAAGKMRLNAGLAHCRPVQAHLDKSAPG